MFWMASTLPSTTSTPTLLRFYVSQTATGSTWYQDQTSTWSQWQTPSQTWSPQDVTEQQMLVRSWYQDAVLSVPSVTIAAPAIRRSRHRAYLIQLDAQQEELRQAAAEHAAERERASRAAADRAEGLLLSHLTEEQQRTFRANRWFVVEGGKSKRQYRIRAGSVVANIDVMEGDRVMHRLCGHVEHQARVPMADHLLAQKVMLELAEDDFLCIANRH